ncbi:MAG: hypothetical protein JXA99_15040 [Candidatus Lokiarchaeota archaeon]|nr:hypothetical protein [Candidatus Lokiarchaeota archaeon]
MVNKGKFRLLSFIINHNLIFYKSTNKKKTFIGFSLLSCKSIESIIPYMNYFLKKRYFNYYSLQLDSENKNLIIMCFKDLNKNTILKCHSIIYNELTRINNSIIFLEEKELENKFLKLVNCSLDLIQFHNNKKKNNQGTNNDNYTLINYFKINFELISKKESFFDTFVNLSKNLLNDIILIINFKINRNNQIILYPYCIEFQQKSKNNLLLDLEINNFFNSKILEKKKLTINKIGLIMWRLSIDIEYFYLLDYTETFYLGNKYKSHNLSDIITNIKEELDKNSIKSLKINDEIVLINENIICVLIQRMNLPLLKKIIKNYYEKYNIFLIFFDSIDYENIIRIQELISLDKIKIINKNQFFELNINVFR